MPSIVRSKMWFCRITVPHAFAKIQIPKVMGWIDLQTVLACTHVGDKTEKEHFHMVLSLSSDLQKQSIDHRLKTIYGVSGADYSSKPWDGHDSACSYLFHDKNYEIIANKGHTDEDIQRYIKLNDDVQKVVEVNKSRASGRHVDKVIELVKQSGSQWSLEQICNEFMRRIRDGDMYEPGDYMLKRYVTEVYIKTVDNEEYKQYCVDRYHKLFTS